MKRTSLGHVTAAGIPSSRGMGVLAEYEGFERMQALPLRARLAGATGVACSP